MSVSNHFGHKECEICGCAAGGGSDHRECAKVKKEIYASENETKYPNRKLSKKQADDLGAYMASRYK